MLSDRITVVIPTKNEQDRLPLALENFAGRLPLLVSDNHSTDGTREIAASAGIPTITLDHPGYYENDQVMPILWSAIATDYLIIAGCAEYFPPALLERLAEIANSGSYDVVYIKRYSVSYGQLIPLSASPEVWQRGELRMYRRGCVDFSDTVIHGSGGRATVAPDRQCTLGQDMATAILQFRDYDSSHNELQNNRYNNLWARQRYARGERFSLVGTGIDCGIAFGACYVRHGAWRHGVGGLIISLQRGIMAFQVGCRLWEMEHNVLKPAVVEQHVALRREAHAALRSGPTTSTATARLSVLLKRMYRDSLLDYRGGCALALLLLLLPWTESTPSGLRYVWLLVVALGFALVGRRRVGVALPWRWQAATFFVLALTAGYVRGGEESLVTGLMAAVTLGAVLWLGPLLQTAPARVFTGVLVGLVSGIMGLVSVSILPAPTAPASAAYATMTCAMLGGVVLSLSRAAMTRERVIRLAAAMAGFLLLGLMEFLTQPMPVFQLSALSVVVAVGFAALLRRDAIAGGALAGMSVLALFPGTWLGAIPLCGVLAALICRADGEV